MEFANSWIWRLAAERDAEQTLASVSLYRGGLLNVSKGCGGMATATARLRTAVSPSTCNYIALCWYGPSAIPPQGSTGCCEVAGGGQAAPLPYTFLPPYYLWRAVWMGLHYSEF